MGNGIPPTPGNINSIQKHLQNQAQTFAGWEYNQEGYGYPITHEQLNQDRYEAPRTTPTIPPPEQITPTPPRPTITPKIQPTMPVTQPNTNNLTTGLIIAGLVAGAGYLLYKIFGNKKEE